MGEELKPCPFCGGEAEEWEVSTYSIDSSYDMFGCRSCGIGFDTGKDAENVKLWNTRPEADTSQVRCAECTCEKGGNNCDWIKSKSDTVTGWQDISTAPNREDVLLYQDGWAINPVIVGRRHGDVWLSDCFEINDPDQRPTHWRSLPPTPEKEG